MTRRNETELGILYDKPKRILAFFLRILWNNSRPSSQELQKTIDACSEDGWTVLADLTDKLHRTNDEIEEKELRWLEVAEELEGVEMEVQT